MSIHGLESVMSKFSSIAAVAAIAVATAAPVVAEESKANVNADPFVSTQGAVPSFALAGAGAGTTLAIIGGVVLVGAVAASGSDGAPVTTFGN